MKNNFSVSIFWLSVFSILIIGYMMISVQGITRASFTKSNGVTISAEDAEDIESLSLNVVSQLDDEWSMEIMCDNIRMRMCNYGSQLCCTSSVFEYYGISYEPDELYDMFLEKGLYDFTANHPFCEAIYEYIYVTYSYTYAEPAIHTETQFDSETVISLLEKGIPVIARTYSPYVERLWVVIIGISDGNFISMDPFTGDYQTLDTYNNRIYELFYFTQE